jgi:hypothetical protein
VNAFVKMPRTRVCSGGSRNSIDTISADARPAAASDTDNCSRASGGNRSDANGSFRNRGSRSIVIISA